MPDPTPIPSASALARAVEASERNRDEIWDEAIEAARAAIRRCPGAQAPGWPTGFVYYLTKSAVDDALRALRRDTPDAR